jgi:lipopolysaccharide/colanic/teichoic acid biosynthesis glycosyltransferase
VRIAPDDVFRVATVRPAGESSPLAGVAYRALDLGLALVLAVLLVPVMALVALAIRLESPGPVIIRERRLGLDLEPFTMHVFRTERIDGLPRSPTRVGRVIKRARADGLPQLWDVLCRRMSLVGPAPARPNDVSVYSVPPCSSHWFLRFAVRPGITGLAQVSSRRDEWTVADMLECDVDYVCRRSLWLNLVILARTPLKLASPRTTLA